LVSYISLTNLAEFEETEVCPEGYQSENVRFVIHAIRKIKDIDSMTLSEILPKLSDTETTTIFGNTRKALSVEEVSGLTYSLKLIKVQNPQIYFKNFADKSSPRMTFAFHQHEYDFPLTDIDFLEYYKNDRSILDGQSEIYVTVLLSKECLQIDCGGVYCLGIFVNCSTDSLVRSQKNFNIDHGQGTVLSIQ
jgi:hypothetical protein